MQVFLKIFLIFFSKNKKGRQMPTFFANYEKLKSGTKSKRSYNTALNFQR